MLKEAKVLSTISAQSIRQMQLLQKMDECTLFHDVIFTLNIFRENSTKIVHLFKNIVKFV